MKHRIFTIFLGNNDGANKINEYLDDGWLVSEIQTVKEKNGCYAVVLIEKEEN